MTDTPVLAIQKWLAILAIVVMASVVSGSSTVWAYEKIYPQTAAGAMEIKALPPARVLEARFDGAHYPASSRRTFYALLSTVHDNGQALTAPVTVHFDQSAMRLYMPAQTVIQQAGSVITLSLQDRTVASIGIKGRYSKENFEEAKHQLLGWLTRQSEWEACGHAYAVYWNPPYLPPWQKYSEVHIPVRKKAPILAVKEN